ncbi:MULTISPECIES: NYN domain-containing protein [Brachybacterium]|uniref:NYN domain-containing protein n=1 Tax=Brachybacterium TaxID=43668 RepID=UPI000DF2F1A3|nr:MULTISPECIES: NYN domain-containing protein [Brachybacterium]RCS63996.1 NYN domain-containing protein [Brachybacterium sp. JB7]RCS64875.1 NYN domain-containing protein [Brachybacterium alimentarium]RCS77496.1 NYN domain-containing protein [Brachybacterium alimentarium]RCS84275.1 NYN domain-containing protein [Brachybacterium alimentarium]
MAEHSDPRVAVYLDFDNIVMSWYDRVHGRNAYSRDRQRIMNDPTEPEIAERLAKATVDVGAIIDYAASFGSLMLTRAYADWSSPVNAEYRSQLVARAVDLVQLFPAAAYAKNGADIRLAVDTVEDMFRTPDLTHVVIVAGDSDFVPLAQRCRRLGRYVIAMGVAGSTAKSLAAACDEFEAYDNLPGVERPDAPTRTRTRRGQGGGQAASGNGGRSKGKGADGTAEAETTARTASDVTDEVEDEGYDEIEDPQEAATRLLERALQLGGRGDSEWLHSSAVKSHMRRMDPSFSEKTLGYRTFSEFLKANSDIAVLEETGHERLVRARD